VFHGRVNHDRVMQLLASSHLFCFPSASEGFPKAVLEALAVGLPVVASGVSVLPILLRDGGGRVLRERTPAAVVEAVSSCLEGPDSYAAMSRSARKTASRYSLEAWSQALSVILSERWGSLHTDGAN
jgi:glycosyltransferase involved in cell wall biosynthesis